jgi:hypothetical protein
MLTNCMEASGMEGTYRLTCERVLIFISIMLTFLICLFLIGHASIKRQ